MYQQQLRQVRQNILDFLKYLDDNNGFIGFFINRVNQSQQIFPDEKSLPYISPLQLQEYYTILEHESLNFIQRHPEIRDIMLNISIKNMHSRPGIFMLSKAWNIFPALRQEINNTYKSVAYQFLWNNYELLQQFKLVPVQYFQ